MSRRPILTYFLLTFILSWTAAFLVAAPTLLRGRSLPDLTGILMFPAMLLGPCLTGLFLTWKISGRAGLRGLRDSLHLPRLFPGYALLLVPPLFVLAVLLILQTLVSPVFAPNRFWVGFAFGVPAGLLEEIGWTGFAYPRMQLKVGTLKAGIVLGLLWSLWHLPVIDFLGSARPHGRYLPGFFLAFMVVMTAIRVMIGWMYTYTYSVLLAQLMHMSSTAALVVFGPPRVTARQEVLWYFVYGIAVWLGVAVLFVGSHRRPVQAMVEI